MPKKSVYLTDAATAAVGEPFSGRLNYLLELGDAALRQSAPALTAGQWLAVCDALRTHFHTYAEGWANVLASAWHSVADAGPECDEKWNVTCTALAAQLQAMPVIQQAAVLEVVRRFWALPAGDSYEAMLATAGANVRASDAAAC